MSEPISDAPERLWLQLDRDGMGLNGDGAWCEDRVNDDDVEYVRADVFARLQEQVEALEFWQNWVYPEGASAENIQKELEDFHMVINEVSKVYDNLTHGQISKPTTKAEIVIMTVEEVFATAQEDE